MYVSISPGVKDSSLLILIKYKKVLSMRLCGQATGEATSQFFPATVHGAFLSGVRAAYEIMLADAKADLIKTTREKSIPTSECLRTCPNEIQILGFIYDLDTGRVQFLQ
jgi:hypothetical protein